MEKQELEVQRRWKTGKGVARKLRSEGFIPAVCYRKGIESISLRLSRKELEKLLKSAAGKNILIQLKIKDEEGAEDLEAVILKDVQRNHLSEPLHCDFLAVRMDEAIQVEVPVRLVGEPTEVLREGGLIQQLKRNIDVECLPAEIPEQVELDISSASIGDSLHVEDISVPEGIRIITDLKETAVVISAPKEEEVEEEVEAEVEGEAPAEGEAAATEGGDDKAGKET